MRLRLVQKREFSDSLVYNCKSITDYEKLVTIGRARRDAIGCSRRTRRVELKLLHRLAYTSTERSVISQSDFPKTYSQAKTIETLIDPMPGFMSCNQRCYV